MTSDADGPGPLELLLGSFEVYKANWLAGAVAAAAQGVPVLGGIVLVNWLTAFRLAERDGKPVSLPDLFDLENAVEKSIGLTAVQVLLLLAAWFPRFPGIGGPLSLLSGVFALFATFVVLMTAAIQATRPRAPFLPAFKAALSFVQAYPGRLLRLGLACWGVCLLGIFPGLVIGLLISIPVAEGMVFLDFRRHHVSYEATAAEAGIGLSDDT